MNSSSNPQLRRGNGLLTVILGACFASWASSSRASTRWRGLLDWLRSTMLAAGNISAPDIELMRIADSPQEVRELILQGLSKQASWCEKSVEAARAATRLGAGSEQIDGT